MSKFEYDKNLGDGWNLNDNAYDNDGFTPYATTDTKYNSSYPEDSDGRGVVLEPASFEDMCGGTVIERPSLEVVYEAV